MNALLADVGQQLADPAVRWEGEAPAEPPRKEARREARPPAFEAVGDTLPEPAVTRTRTLGGRL